jgi:hypothetical protein
VREGADRPSEILYVRHSELIRTTPPKPLRIWLHAATRDLNWNRPDANWLSANLQLAAALRAPLALADGAGDVDERLQPGVPASGRQPGCPSIGAQCAIIPCGSITYFVAAPLSKSR